VRLYVDGELVEQQPLAFPKVSGKLQYCCIGTNPRAPLIGLQTARRRRTCALFANLGPVYVLKDPIGPQAMRKLAVRGADYLPAMRAPSGTTLNVGSLDGLPRDEIYARHVALDQEISPKLLMLYHPRMLDNDTHRCPDLSSDAAVASGCPPPRPAVASGLTAPSATLYARADPGLVAAARHPLRDALHALGEGGPSVLLPLVAGAVDHRTQLPEVGLDGLGDPTLTVRVAAVAISIMAKSCRQHTLNQEAVARSCTPWLLAHLLALVLAFHPTEAEEQQELASEQIEVVEAVLVLTEAIKHNTSLCHQVYRSLLLDLRVWVTAEPAAQRHLLQTLARLAATPEGNEHLRGMGAVQRLVDMCRDVYWGPQHLSSRSSNWPRPEIAEQGPWVGCKDACILTDDLLYTVQHILSHPACYETYGSDMRVLVQFTADCPYKHQVSRMLGLFHRMLQQADAKGEAKLADALLQADVAELLLQLVWREANADEADARTAPPQACPQESAEPASPSKLTADDGVLEDVEECGVLVGCTRLLGWLMLHRRLSDTVVAAATRGLSHAIQSSSRRFMTITMYQALLNVSLELEEVGAAVPQQKSAWEVVLNGGPCRLLAPCNLLLQTFLPTLAEAPHELQSRVLEDLLLLACAEASNRRVLTDAVAWPHWLVRLLLLNMHRDPAGAGQQAECAAGEAPLRGSPGRARRQARCQVKELGINLLSIMLKHGLREKGGWLAVEQALHNFDWARRKLKTSSQHMVEME
ncbi:hypothetical protein CYMTET_21819, partial [Cymbomonas tetramitiformis]